MPKHHISIDAETMDVLKRSDITTTSLKLPAGQLPRPLYEKVNKVLTAAGGKWNRSQQSHVFSDDPRAALGMALETGSIRDEKKATQAFYTPNAIANLLVTIASVEGRTVLEPSAGRGAIADKIRDAGGQVTCIEMDTKSAAFLRDSGHGVIDGDFMEQLGGEFERVVMNPPFENGQDVQHVMRAFDMLKRGGRLVSIMSPSWRTKGDRKSTAFRELVEQYGRVDQELPPGTFKESGTNVATVIVVLDKP